MHPRPHYLNELIKYLDTEFIKVITGVRRSGKSFLLKMLAEHLEKQKKPVLYLNFEHPDTFKYHRADELYRYIQTYVENHSQTSERLYFLFDEIGEVEGWQRLINGLRVAFNCDIYLTGSNAKLLSGELATHLAGRYVEIKIHPLSLKEMQTFKGEENVDLLLEEYLQYGGFPSVVLTKDPTMKKEILSGIYDSIVLRDVALRGGITQIDILFKIVTFLLDNIGHPISSPKLSAYFKSQHQNIKPDTINRYLQLLEDAFIFYKAPRYDIRGKEYLKTLGKYYVVDLGLKNMALGRKNTNLGAMVENVVYLELIRRGYRVFVGKYDDREIDFVAFKEEETLYVQVMLSFPKHSKRESENLLLIKDHYQRLIITYDYKDVGVIAGIPVIHLTQFLMGE